MIALSTVSYDNFKVLAVAPDLVSLRILEYLLYTFLSFFF